MSEDLGERYLDAYERFFGQPVGHRVFRNPEGRAIQVLQYEGVFPRCSVFSTLGFSHFADEARNTAEVYVPVDAAQLEVPQLISESLFHVAKSKIAMGRGTAVGGLSCINSSFCRRWGKTAIYYTMPFGLPEDFGIVTYSGGQACILLGLFLSQAEFLFHQQHGGRELELLLEACSVDPYVLSRPSCVP